MYTQSYKFATNWLSWKDPSQTQSKKRNTADVELVAVIFCSILITVRNSATKFIVLRWRLIQAISAKLIVMLKYGDRIADGWRKTNKKPGALIRPHIRVELLWQKSNKVPLWKRSCQLGQEFHLHCSIVSQSCMKYEILIEHEYNAAMHFSTSMIYIFSKDDYFNAVQAV